MAADQNLNQPKINVEISSVFTNDKEDSDENLETDEYDKIPPLAEYDLEEDSEDESTHDEDLEFDEDMESLRIWNLVDEDLKYIASKKFSEHDKIPPLSEYDLESEYTHEENGLKHANEITESCASSPLPSQAKETSNKPPQTDNSSREGMKVKKLESIRLDAILPDNIWLNLNENLNVPLEDSE